jgi:response regulator RpfG family c-di-GMP phosphodiesterase
LAEKMGRNKFERNYRMNEKGLFFRRRLDQLVLSASSADKRQTTQLVRAEIEKAGEAMAEIPAGIPEDGSHEASFHMIRVAEHSRLLALRFGLSESEADLLRRASPLHDIGKIAIPNAVLFKPGRLSPEERAIMQTHAEIGYDLLRHSDYHTLQAAAIVAHEHHERWNGYGYPRGLRGGKVHIYGRVNAIADVFDALINERCYKPAWSLNQTIEYFHDQRGREFDPALVDALLEGIDDFIAIQNKFQPPKKPGAEIAAQ